VPLLALACGLGDRRHQPIEQFAGICLGQAAVGGEAIGEMGIVYISPSFVINDGMRVRRDSIAWNRFSQLSGTISHCHAASPSPSLGTVSTGWNIMPIARSILITGHVHGVFFREWTVKVAGQHQVDGWVRNRRDDSVEIYATAEPEQLERFIAQVKIGSPASKVDKVEVTPTALEDVQGFMRRSTA
jgi:acylphosphatase